MAFERVSQIASHLIHGTPAATEATPSLKGVAALAAQSPNDVVITLAVRTPLCKAGKGGLKDTRYATLSAEIESELTLAKDG